MGPKRRRPIFVEGPTVKEAIANGLSLLKVPRSRVSVKVLSEESRGLFGMRGAKPAKIRISLKVDSPS